MKWLKVSILMLLSLLAGPAFADGHAVGNGGGVICINGKCQTLTEAGLSVSLEYDGVWLPEPDHYTAVQNRIEAGLTLAKSAKNIIFNRTFVRADHFRKVDIVDPAKLELIKELYLQTAEEAGFHIDPATFQVVAFSSDNTVKPAMTYLLPAFFDLGIEQQAAIIIHEGLYRERQTADLKYVLQFESAMQTTLDSKGDKAEKYCKRSNLKNCVDQQITAYRLNILKKDEMIGYILSLVMGGYYQHHFFYDQKFPSFNDFGILSETSAPQLLINHDLLLQLGKVEPRLPYMFSKVDSIPLKFISTDVYTSDRVTGHGKFIASDWGQQNPTYFLSCFQRFGSSMNCRNYLIADPESIPLILPK